MQTKCELDSVAKKICDSLQYQYIGYIDAGNYKETYYVKGPAGCEYALKIFKQNNSSERTEREIDAMKRAYCDNIARLILVSEFETDNLRYLYLIEEYLGGGSLTSLINTQSINRNDIIRIGKDIIQALISLHNARIVHRDIKPDNIMFRSNNGAAVLVDLGLVRDLEASSLTQAFQMQGPGTPLYSSPEQLTNQKTLIDWRTDQFALGITLCIAHFRVHPFGQETPLKTIERVASFQQCNAEIQIALQNGGLEPIIQMIEPYPIKRFRTPSQLITAWERL